MSATIPTRKGRSWLVVRPVRDLRALVGGAGEVEFGKPRELELNRLGGMQTVYTVGAG